MFGIGTPELLIIAGIFVLLFGSAKLPTLMRNMGRSINEFKAGMKDAPKTAGGNGRLEEKREDE